MGPGLVSGLHSTITCKSKYLFALVNNLSPTNVVVWFFSNVNNISIMAWNMKTSLVKIIVKTSNTLIDAPTVLLLIREVFFNLMKRIFVTRFKNIFCHLVTTNVEMLLSFCHICLSQNTPIELESVLYSWFFKHIVSRHQF